MDGQSRRERRDAWMEGEMEVLIRLNDADWSKHVMCDGHRMIPPRVGRLRLRIQECVAFIVLVSDATC
jgi:hypothetical protein